MGRTKNTDGPCISCGAFGRHNYRGAYLLLCYKCERIKQNNRLRIFRKNNPLHNSESVKKFNLRHPAKLQWHSISAGSRRGKPDISKSDFIDWYNSVPKECHYCGISEDDAKSKYGNRLHTDRMNNSIGYTTGNLAPACRICNVSKSNFFSAEEWKEIAKKYVRPKWQAK